MMRTARGSTSDDTQEMSGEDEETGGGTMLETDQHVQTRL